MNLLRGKRIADEILAKIYKDLHKRKTKPGLAVILIGKNKASEIYVKLKQKAAEKVGIEFSLIKFSEKINQRAVINKINRLNNDKSINGIIVQLPLPGHLDPQEIIKSIDPEKDADGFHPTNVKSFSKGNTKVYPVFPRAILRLLESSKINFKNKNAIVIANSDEFGKIMVKALKSKDLIAKYFLTKETGNNLDKLKEADILIIAIGKPNLIKGSMIKKGSIVIDGGISKMNNKIVGDVDFLSTSKVASLVSPVPGGVGPLTIACLLENVKLLSKNL